jgi:hypothetical protein
VASKDNNCTWLLKSSIVVYHHKTKVERVERCKGTELEALVVTPNSGPAGLLDNEKGAAAGGVVTKKNSTAKSNAPQLWSTVTKKHHHDPAGAAQLGQQEHNKKVTQ